MIGVCSRKKRNALFRAFPYSKQGCSGDVVQHLSIIDSDILQRFVQIGLGQRQEAVYTLQVYNYYK